jgi:Flp pilus assembly protein TadD, contains TPR repeats
VNSGYLSRLIVVTVFLCPVAIAAVEVKQESQELNRQFQAAVSHYDAGQFAEAATELEALLPRTPKSFEVHELLGLVYAAQLREAQALEQLHIAVELNPRAAVARTNLAASLLRVGKLPLAEEQFRKAIALDPRNYEANHNLGELYTQSGRLAEAVPYLKAAQSIRPTYDNGYNLALACFLTGELAAASDVAHALLREKNTGELHNLLGQIDEKEGQFVDAANEFGAAAQMDPSEDNLFAWGGEMLLHRAYDPAIDIFEQATARYPKSPRLFIGLGMALYSRARYDEAVKALLTAADLKPDDPRCYFFLSKAFASTPIQADDVIARFKRYAELEPDNASGAYFYAIALWKGKRADDPEQIVPQIESLLQRAIALDPKMVDAHMQLGRLYSDQREYAKSIVEYQSALAVNPDLPDAHYRLGQAYIHTGQKDRAQAELDVYQNQRAQHHAELDKERAEVKQFVYSANAAPTK